MNTNEPVNPEPASTNAAASAPGRSRYGWGAPALNVAAILVIGSIAGALVLIVPAAIGMAMIFVGPFYASYFVPTTIAHWRRAAVTAETSNDLYQERSPNQRYILNFGTTNQRMTLIVNVVLLVNLVSSGLFSLTDFLHPTSDGALFSPIFIFGFIAVVAGIPLMILNIKWRLLKESVPVEATALRHELGSWRLIRVGRMLSMAVWCGYPAASILVLALGTTFGR